MTQAATTAAYLGGFSFSFNFLQWQSPPMEMRSTA